MTKKARYPARDKQRDAVIREYLHAKDTGDQRRCIRITEANPDIDFAIIDELGIESLL